MADVLYLTYDGLTDQLGQSQVLPYVAALTRRGHRFTLVSFEKPAAMARLGAEVGRQLAAIDARWVPLRYTKRPPILSTIYDVFRLYRRAKGETRLRNISLVHCRGYVPALVGRRLSRACSIPFVFDLRGFWPEEKVDAGAWDLRKSLYRHVYAFFKREERHALSDAAAVIALTERGARELEKRPELAGPSRLTVIPCSVDFEAFERPALCREQTRAQLQIGPTDSTLAYVGSLGTWYMLAEMIDFFLVYRGEFGERARFLLLTPEDPRTVSALAIQRGVPQESLIIRSVRFAEVPSYLSAADCGLSFIRPSFSKISSSPTKIAEYLAADLPVVTNRGIGDVDTLLDRVRAGAVVDSFDRRGYVNACHQLRLLKARPPGSIRRVAREMLNLGRAADLYAGVYDRAMRQVPAPPARIAP